jgi:hypothetical protein
MMASSFFNEREVVLILDRRANSEICPLSRSGERAYNARRRRIRQNARVSAKIDMRHLVARKPPDMRQVGNFSV